MKWKLTYIHFIFKHCKIILFFYTIQNIPKFINFLIKNEAEENVCSLIAKIKIVRVYLTNFNNLIGQEPFYLMLYHTGKWFVFIFF